MDSIKTSRLKQHLNRIKEAHPLNSNLYFHDLMLIITKDIEIIGIINELNQKGTSSLSIKNEEINRRVDKNSFKFNTNSYSSSFYGQLTLKYRILYRIFHKNKDLIKFSKAVDFLKGDYSSTRLNNLINYLIEPLVYYICDQVEKNSAILNLLTKYKKRKEWFYRKSFFEQFKNEGSKEFFLEMDLRSFLFENGIKYPFSNINTPNGRPDIVADIDKEDAIVLEVKLLKSGKTTSYGKEKIISGFSQAIKYTSDLQKPIGYIVIFNTNPKDVEISIKDTKSYPVEYEFNGIKYFFIIININPSGKSASEIGQTEFINLNPEDLIKNK